MSARLLLRWTLPAMLTAVAVLTFAGPVAATDGFTLLVGGAEVDPGDAFVLPVIAEWLEPLMGFTVSIQFPALPPVSDLDVTIENTLTGALDPEFFVVNIDESTGELVSAILFEVTPPLDGTVLDPVGIPLAIVEIVGTVNEGTPEQTLLFDFVDGLGSPPANNIFVVENESLPPETTTGGELLVRDLINPPENLFIRGDVDLNGAVNLADPIFHLNYTFLGGPLPECEDAGDANDDGSSDITDAIYLLTFLFLDAPQPWPPYPTPGTDPTPDNIGCDYSPF